MKPRRWQDWALLLTLVVVWGSSFAATKIGVETISPVWLVALRMAVAALVLVPLAFVRGPGLPRLSAQWGWLALLTVLDMHHINATLDNIWGPHMFMPTVPELLLGWARFLLVFAVLCWIGDRIKRAPGKWNPVNVFSRGILYIYVFHSILFANLIKYLEPSSGSLPVLAVFIAVQLVIAYGIGVLGIRLKQIERLRGILP